MKNTNLIVDLSNVVHASKYVSLKELKGEFSKAFIINKVMNDMMRAVERFKATGMLIAADGRKNWRKRYDPTYKANRVADEHTEAMSEILDELIDFFQTKTDIPVIRVDRAEADDVIALAVAMTNNDCVIYSTDKDFIQLTSDRVKLYSPTQDKIRESEDTKFDLFVKCIRGDRGDNVYSAYPRVRLTKLQKAWDDPLEMVNIMETTRKDGVRVKDAFEHNKKLIDLSQQPPDVRGEISDAINSIKFNRQKYKFVNVLRFFGKYELKDIASQMTRFSRMFKLTFLR